MILLYVNDAAILKADSVLQKAPINAFAAPLGLSYHGPGQNSKTWVPVTRRRQSS